MRSICIKLLRLSFSLFQVAKVSTFQILHDRTLHVHIKSGSDKIGCFVCVNRDVVLVWFQEAVAGSYPDWDMWRHNNPLASCYLMEEMTLGKLGAVGQTWKDKTGMRMRGSM